MQGCSHDFNIDICKGGILTHSHGVGLNYPPLADNVLAVKYVDGKHARLNPAHSETLDR